MPINKGRSNKRSSSSTSYTSTITTIVFIALCVLAVWMLSSNNIMSPQTATTRTATSNTNNDDFRSSSYEDTSRVEKPVVDKRTTPAAAFEDTQGDLPDDAIKPDEPQIEKSQTEQKTEQETSNESEQSNDNDKKHVTEEDEQKPKEEIEDEQKPKEEIVEEQKPKEEIEEEQKPKEEIEEEQKPKEEIASVVDENPQKESSEEQEKPKEHETQTSEESSMTQTQHAEQIDHDNQSVSTSETDHHDKDPQMINTDGSKTNKQVDEQEKNIQEHIQKEKEAAETSQDTYPQSTSEGDKQTMEHQNDKRDDISNTPQSQISTEEHQESTQKSEIEPQQNGNNPNQAITKKQDTATPNSGVSFPTGENSGIPKESKESKKSWSTQADQSENEKERRKDGSSTGNDGSIYGYTWQLCNVTAGYDYIPCLDNEKALKQLHSTKHYEHRERHCPEEGPTCLVPVPEGYKIPIEWPNSRDKIWYHNVPHTLLAEVKGHQNWVKVTGEFLTFPGGGTQFIHGALHYIDFVQQSVANIAWGKRTRVILDVGCGVASFGGFLFERDVLAMSFAPKDEHEAQVQFALERGIPAISAVMGSQRLPFPSRVFDLIHCARCRVPWHENGGALLLELNRILRPGGHFVWSATPVYQKLQEDVEIWEAMSSLTQSMCWELVTIQKDALNSVGAAIYRKPTTNDCYDQRQKNRPPMCKNDDDPNAAWYVPLQACMHRAPTNGNERGSKWPVEWPLRVQTPPYWLNKSQMGIYGKPAPIDFETDYEHWQRVVNKLYLTGLGISWSNVRNVMDMRAVYGGFAAALKDLKMWVVNVVNVDSPDTLPIIYERGLFGIYHDWCESFSTYPRTYDLLHADHLFSRVKKRCKLAPLMAEVDRIVRPGGKLIVRDESTIITEVENFLKSLHWEVHLTFSKDQEGILSARKSDWRPDTYAVSS